MLKASIIAMEKSCKTKHFKNNAEVLLNVSNSELSKYKPISIEMVRNKAEAINLINHALSLLIEYNE